MFHLGLDLHKLSICLCVLDENGKVFSRSTLRTPEQLVDFLGHIPGPFQACFEASCGYGFWFELVSQYAEIVQVAHPASLSLIFRSKRKNDRVDALKLAKLLYLGEVPRVHVPNAEVRAWRELITFRKKLIQKRTAAKNGIRALLRSVGVRPPQRPGLWTKSGQRWLQQLEFAQSLQALKRDMLIEEIKSLGQQIQCVEKELKVYSENHPAVALLQTIPGVGLRTAEAFVAFLDDPGRFPNAKAVGAYFGLVPCQDQSGQTNRLGHITKDGSATVRHLLTEAVWQAAGRSPSIHAYFQRISRGDQDRRKIAVVATAHYLARVMWSMLKHNTAWREHPQFAQAA